MEARRGGLVGEWTRGRRVGNREAPSLLDWAIAAVLLAVGLAEVVGGTFSGPMALAAIVQVGSLLAVAFRRVAPLVAIAVSAAAYLPHAVAFGAPGSLAQLLAGLVLFHAIGRHADLRGTLAGSAIGALMIVVQGLSGAMSGAADWTFAFALSAAALGVGIGQRRQSSRADALARSADQALVAQRLVAEEAVQQERSRIARELHDVVAHNIGLIALQAGGARTVLPSDPDRAREALARVEQTARQTLVEMRHLVGILREADAPRRPLPGLAGLPALVDEARESGLALDLRVVGQPVELPAGVDLAAYRIVQEALTNARRHASRAACAVDLAYGPDQLRITVTNEAGERDASAVEGAGHGLIGMRERVRLYGGSLEAGPTPNGGFRVSGCLPLRGKAP